MVNTFRQAKINFFGILPLVILLFISLNGSSVIDFSLFKVNIQYILVYFWVLRHPGSLGYGFIFLSGVITDVISGFPLGVHALSLLVIAGVAAYVRTVTVRITLLNDWVSFIPALLIVNFINYFSLYVLDYNLDYMLLLKHSISTFFFYPVFWIIFILILNLSKN
jgi:cell shape-determining protein MreD